MARHGLPAAAASPTDSHGARIAGVEPALRRVAAGAALFRQGDATFGFFRLVSGRIRLARVTP